MPNSSNLSSRMPVATSRLVARRAPPEHSRCILIVEDEPTIAKLLAHVLGDEEYEVRVASNGSRALEMAAAVPPELVLLDLMLPDMNGQELYREFRARGFTAPVVVISAASTGRQQAQDMGADSFIGKPFDIDSVLATVERLLAP